MMKRDARCKYGWSRGWKPWASATACVCVLLFAPCMTMAQVPDEVVASVDDAGVLDRLNADDFVVRQRETRRMMSDEALTREDLDYLYSLSTTPEQRHRLLLVARHRLIRGMMRERLADEGGPGSMGLSHHVVQVTVPGEAAPRTGVLVVMTLPGFPAYALLEPGDMIIDFAGEPIPQNMTPAQFQQTIKTFQTGQEIGLNIVRDGVVEPILFRLGPGRGLGEVYDTGGVTLNEPYRSAWESLRAKMRALVGGGEDAGTTTEPAAPATE